jgi:hypothetical protein
MALKRINKELTDLGRYVLFAPKARLAACSHDSLPLRGAMSRIWPYGRATPHPGHTD